ncbi:MAG TPA: tetratricopeptide repeat protein [Stellaceae bacterium]|nr:tetratricopeptide repeat protein [Stellaceae bacterium]
MNRLPVADLLANAVAAHRRGDLAAAEAGYRELVAEDGRHFHALLGLGVIRMQGGRREEAAEFLRRAVDVDPNSADAHANLAQVLFQLNRTEPAGEVAARAIALDPDHANAHNVLGLVHLAEGRAAEARVAFTRAASLAPGFVDPHCNLAEAAGQEQRFDNALRHARQAVSMAPSRFETQIALGRALTRARHFKEAIGVFEAMLRQCPKSPDALVGLGTALVRAGHVETAIGLIEEALQSLPREYDLIVHLGDLLLARGDTAAALERYRQAEALHPDTAPAQTGLAMALALQGDLRGAFARFEWRLGAYGKNAFRVVPERRWQGEDIAGRTIVLYSEQGFGDTLQFVRYAPLVAERGARVVLEVPPALKDLFTGMAGVAEIVGTDQPLPGYDAQCPIMSLPAVFGTTLKTVPATVPYLNAPAARSAEWARALGPLDRPRIGVVWAGNTRHTHDHYRSIPLERMLPLFELSDARFVTLQKEKRPRDAALLSTRLEVLDLGARLNSFADTAAAIAQLDLVIAVDTSVAHLAGALGVPTWILLCLSPDWRWMDGGTDSPWYPTVRLFRQSRLGDWDSVVADVCAALAGWLERYPGGQLRSVSGT